MRRSRSGRWSGFIAITVCVGLSSCGGSSSTDHREYTKAEIMQRLRLRANSSGTAYVLPQQSSAVTYGGACEAIAVYGTATIKQDLALDKHFGNAELDVTNPAGTAGVKVEPGVIGDEGGDAQCLSQFQTALKALR